MGDKEGAAPGEIISASTVPVNEVVTKLLVDLIASLLLLVCRRKEAEIDIIPELFQTTMAIEFGADSDGFSKARAHLTKEGVGLSSSHPSRPSIPMLHLAFKSVERISQTSSAFAGGCLSLAVGPYSGSTHHRTITPQVRALS
jgi:hypothetical protein